MSFVVSIEITSVLASLSFIPHAMITVIGKRYLPNGPFSAFFNDFEIFNGPFLIILHRLVWAIFQVNGTMAHGPLPSQSLGYLSDRPMNKCVASYDWTMIFKGQSNDAIHYRFVITKTTKERLLKRARHTRSSSFNMTGEREKKIWILIKTGPKFRTKMNAHLLRSYTAIYAPFSQ